MSLVWITAVLTNAKINTTVTFGLAGRWLAKFCRLLEGVNQANEHWFLMSPSE